MENDVVGDQYNTLRRRHRGRTALSVPKGAGENSVASDTTGDVAQRFDGKCFKCGAGHRAEDLLERTKTKDGRVRSAATRKRRMSATEEEFATPAGAQITSRSTTVFVKILEHRT